MTECSDCADFKVDVAVLKEQISGLRDQQKAHISEVKEILNKISSQLKEEKIESQKKFRYYDEIINKAKGGWVVLGGMSVLGGIIGSKLIQLAGVLIK